MLDFINSMWAWLPGPLQSVFMFLLVLFFLYVVISLIITLFELIPFM